VTEVQAIQIEKYDQRTICREVLTYLRSQSIFVKKNLGFPLKNMGLFDFFKKTVIPEKTEAKAIISDDITDSHQIEFHLEEIIKESGFVTLHLDDDPAERYSSMLIRLEKGEEPMILIDTLIPEEGNDIIENSRKLTFSYIFKGKHFGFESKYIGMEKEDFIAFKIAMPQEIKKEEHRRFVRIKPSLNEPVYVLSEEGGVEEAADVSAGGLAFYTERIIEEGEIYDKFTFTLPPENHKMHTPAEVLRFIEGAAPSRKDKHICCIKFSDMKQSHTEILIKYVFQRERQSIQERLDLGR
tara:strand:+ start:4427 stop:5317 length:891 start_codon:yes stop_codon:yes gene_type:complete